MSCAETTELIENRLGVDSCGLKEPCIRWGSDLQGKGNLERDLSAHCKVGLQGISGVSQGNSVGGSSNAVVRCQYCSKLCIFLPQ